MVQIGHLCVTKFSILRTSFTIHFTIMPQHSHIAILLLTSALAAAQSATITSFACNPAHSYPAGQVCATDSAGSLVLSSVSTTSAPYPAGSTLPDGGYVCNPAHSYPAGQTCVAGTAGTPTLSPVGTTSAAYPAGSTLPNGGYVCNPAHAYPTGQTCVAGPSGLYTLSYSGSATGMNTWAAMTTKPASGTTSTGSGTASPSVSVYRGAGNSLTVSPAIPLLALFALF